MPKSEIEELLKLNQRLLDSITHADWETYSALCDESLTAFEPEALGQFVEGLGFHHYYFKLGGIKTQHHTTMCSPHVRLLGTVAVVSFVRLIQIETGEKFCTIGFEETRIWEKQNGQWKHVHFHRSKLNQQWP